MTSTLNYQYYASDIIKFIQNLVRVPSINGINNETNIIKLIAREAKKLNLPFQIISKDKNHPNIFVGNNFSKKKGLLLIAHVDTADVGDQNKWIHNPFGGEIKDGKLYGRGSIDCKAGIALSLYTLKILSDLGQADLVKFIGVSDEEKGADSKLGARCLLERGLKAKFAIYTYPGNDTITIGHRGQVKFWVRVTGESAHSGSKSWQDGTSGANAIDALISFLNEIRTYNLKGVHKAFPNYFFKQTVVLIEGGSISGMVPDKAHALIDARLLPIHSSQEYIIAIKKIAKKFESNKIQFKIEVQTNLPASFISPNQKIVTILKDLSKNILKKNPEIRGCGPANEGYMFNNANIPTICGFGVNGGRVHSTDEYLELESIPQILRIYVEAALAI